MEMDFDFENVKKQFEENKYWGLSTAIDIYAADKEKIKDEFLVKAFMIQLADEVLKMKRFSECLVYNFGSGNKEGFTAVQLIETSNITAHFCNDSGDIYLDVFSCKIYDPQDVANFAMDYFGSEKCATTYLYRG